MERVAGRLSELTLKKRHGSAEKVLVGHIWVTGAPLWSMIISLAGAKKG